MPRRVRFENQGCLQCGTFAYMVWAKLIGFAEKRLKLNTSPRKYVDKQNFIESPGLRHRVKGPSAINNICTKLSIRFLEKVPFAEDQIRWVS